MKAPIAVGVDTGGTFTDFIFLDDEGCYTVEKRPSTPEDPGKAIYDGLMQWIEKNSSDKPPQIMHGTTVATNALLERKGARLAMVTTRGFKDLIQIGRQDRPHIYDLAFQEPTPLVASELRFEISERITAGGKLVQDLELNEIPQLKQELSQCGADCIVICLLFSAENPIHEELLASELKSLGLPVICSSQIVREIREYERFSTACISAYVTPVMERYLNQLRENLKPSKLWVMGSSGGLFDPEHLNGQAVRTILSGPAGGVIAAQELAKTHSEIIGSGLVTFDMGGTSTDVCLLGPNSLPRTKRYEMDALAISLSMIAVQSVGAGGGSIAWVDAGGALCVGPQSAGASPGPICYGRGGQELTVTDANLYLGRIPRDTKFGGDMALDLESVKIAMSKMAALLSISPLELARGIVRIVEAEMERVLRRITQERGLDPKEFALCPFGGAAGLHAISLAKSLGMKKVLLPPEPGTLSARGMLMANREECQSIPMRALWSSELSTQLKEQAEILEEQLLESMRCQHEFNDYECERELSLRFCGQSHVLEVPWDDALGDPIELFFQEYERRYHQAERDLSVEVVALACRIRVNTNLKINAEIQPSVCVGDESTGNQLVYLDDGEEEESVPVVMREEMLANNVGKLNGPAIVLESTSTFYLPPGAQIEVLKDNSLLISL